MPLNICLLPFLSFRSSGKVICHHHNRGERHPVHSIYRNMAILPLYTHYLRDKTDGCIIIIVFVYPSFPLPSSSLSENEFSVDERLVPVSRVDYQNIILYALHYYCYCHLFIFISSLLLSIKTESSFFPRAKESK